MKFIGFLLLLFSLLPVSANSDSSSHPTYEESFIFPTIFIENQGQWDAEVLFAINQPTFKASFLQNKVIISLNNGDSSFNYGLSFGNKELDYEIEGKSNNTNNYFKQGKNIQSNGFHTLKILDVFPKIDVRFYGSDNGLAYDFVVKPGGDIQDIDLRFEGIDQLKINQNKLTLGLYGHNIEHSSPLSYQLDGNVKQFINSNYVLIGETSIGYEVNDIYNPALNLIIDPIVLSWGTYMGGAGFGYSQDIFVDKDGFIYATGDYNDGLPITVGAYKGSPGGTNDAYLLKLLPDASEYVFATYIGGTSTENAEVLKVNAMGEAIIAGRTFGETFPHDTIYEVQSQYGWHNYITKFSQDGSSILSSVLYGDGNFITMVLDDQENLYLTGAVEDASFIPITSNAFDTTKNGNDDVFLAKFSPDLLTLKFSTYFGGSGHEGSSDILISKEGRIFINGHTSSTNLPANAFLDTLSGTADGFIACFDTLGQLLSSTYLGGEGYDVQSDLLELLDGSILTGGNSSSSTTFPLKNALFPTPLNFSSATLTKFNSDLTEIDYSTFAGVKDISAPFELLQTKNGDIFMLNVIAVSTGPTEVPDPFEPSRYPFKPCAFDTAGRDDEVTLTVYDAEMTEMKYFTLIGGENEDYLIPSMQIKEGECLEEVIISFTTKSHLIYTTAGTVSPNKQNGNVLSPVTEPFFMALKPEITPDFNFSSLVPECNEEIDFTNLTDECGLINPVEAYLWDFGDGTFSTDHSPTHAFGNPGDYDVTLYTKCPIDSISKTVSVSGIEASGSATGAGIVCKGDTIQLMASGGVSYSWTPVEGLSNPAIANPKAAPTNNTTYFVSIFNSSGCSESVQVLVEVDSALADFIFNDTCLGAPVNFESVDNQNEYKWKTSGLLLSSSKSFSKIFDEAGEFDVQLTVTNANACNDSIIKVVTINEATEFTLGMDSSICEGGEVLLTPSVFGDTYNWNTNEETSTITVKDSGEYSLTLSINGCLANDTFHLSFKPEPVAFFSEEVDGMTVIFESPDTTGVVEWYWDLGDRSASKMGKDITHNYAQEGAFLVTLIVRNECGLDTFSKTVSIFANSLSNINNTQFELYPNPVTDKLNVVNRSSHQIIEYKLSSMDGKHNSGFTELKNNLISIANLKFPSGIYLLQLKTESGILLQKKVLFENPN
ncbi:MAG: PKD repeat protein [Sphingobacteriales bacterium]|jgi:PKD repeat protein